MTFASSSAIWPIVGVLDRRPEFTINPSEVDRAFTVSLSDLVADGAFLEERGVGRRFDRGADDEGYFPTLLFQGAGRPHLGRDGAGASTELLALVTGVAWPSDRGVRGQSGLVEWRQHTPVLWCFLSRRTSWRKLRSASSNRLVRPTALTTSRSFPHGELVTPKTSTSRGRLTPTSSNCPYSVRPWTARCRR